MATKQPDRKPQADLQQVVTPIKDATNVLVTINSSPTVDQLASCIGLTLVLNKLGKHATSVFSGDVPSTLEFLKPEETLEKNTDSLRDFIIALDKSKADKLRYKVEDDVVKIFITPYKTSITEEDLEFSQGDFNVDVVIALGVDEKKHLDQAILGHGRILHDATVISINTQGVSHIGAINWSSPEASSLCEMVTDIVQSLSKDVLDKQNATALLTGIVAETERYSNEKATPHTMSIAGALMSAGASTQLVSNELDSGLKSQELPDLAMGEDSPGDDGVLDIDHASDNQSSSEDIDQTKEDKPSEGTQQEAEQQDSSSENSDKPQDEYLDHLNLSQDPKAPDEKTENNTPDQEENSSTRPPATARIMREPPHFTGQLTANTVGEDKQYTGSTDPLTNLPESSILGEKKEDQKSETPIDAALQQKVDQTLREIEESVSSPHLAQEEQQVSSPPTSPSVDEARRAAEAAAIENARPQAREDSDTTPLGEEIKHNNDSSPSSNSNPPPPVPPPMTPNP